MRSAITAFSIATLLLGNQALASDECSDLLSSGPTTLIPSKHQTAAEREELKKAIEIIFGENGIARRLGLAVPPHIIEMMPSEILLALATLGRNPLPHWVDGRKIDTLGDQARGVMEFATTGCPTCRSFYRDTTDFEEQLEILFHVAGHNDFSEHSIYSRSRPSDVMADSRKLADMIAEAYMTYGKAEVGEFVQHMYATAHLQDFALGTFEAPGHTSPQTPSILQAMSSLMSREEPAWKHALLEQFEKVQRFFPYVVSTKIMNEGWATFLMKLMLKHSPWANTAQGFRHGKMMQGVAYPSIENPYWLGREAWERVYARFMLRSEIRALPSAFEKDRAFIAYAHSHFIDTKNDVQFLSEALDPIWVTSKNLLLSRVLPEEEQDPNLPPPPPGKFKNPVQKGVASREPKEIIRSIVSQVADRTRQFPRLRLDSTSLPGSLVLIQDASAGVPLLGKSIGATLFAIHKIIGGPVRLKALVKNVQESKSKSPPQLGWIDVQIGKSGAHHVYGSTSVGLSGDSVTHYQRLIGRSRERYKKESDRLYLKFSKGTQLSKEEAQILSESHVLNLHYFMRTVTDHAPTLAQAREEYRSMLDFSQRIALAGILNEDSDQDAITVSAQGITLNVLPEIPEFALDRAYSETSVQWQTTFGTLAAKKIGDLDEGPYAPDEKFFGEDPSQSDGDGDGDGDESDESDGNAKKGQSNGPKPGGEAQKPTVAKIPLETWGKLLQKHLELPNLRRTQGLSTMSESQREGGARRPNGQILWHRTAMDAYGWGRVILQRKGLLKPTTSFDEIMKEGFKHMPLSNYTVADREEAPQPEMSAVVVFVVDKSGSMGGDPLKIAQNAVYNILALLKAAYPKVEARFVAFDDKAHESNMNDFFTTTLGGGTKYTAGIEKTEEILESYPREKWNRYVYFFGDGDDSDEDATREGMQSLAKTTEFTGFGLVDPSGRNLNGKLTAATRDLARQVPWFGFAHITKSTQSMFDALKSFFGKRPQKQ